MGEIAFIMPNFQETIYLIILFHEINIQNNIINQF